MHTHVLQTHNISINKNIRCIHILEYYSLKKRELFLTVVYLFVYLWLHQGLLDVSSCDLHDAHLRQRLWLQNRKKN